MAVLTVAKFQFLQTMVASKWRQTNSFHVDVYEANKSFFLLDLSSPSPNT